MLSMRGSYFVWLVSNEEQHDKTQISIQIQLFETM